MADPHPILVELRAERKARGLRQADLARAMGTCVSGISVIETGVKGPYLATVARYADALGYDLTLTPKPLPPITPEQAAHNRAVLEAAIDDPALSEELEGTDPE